MHHRSLVFGPVFALFGLSPLTLAHADDAPVAPQDVEAHASPPAPTWTSGYHDDRFFLRSPDDVFRLYVQARVHVDFSRAFGAGVSSLTPDSSLNDGFFLRRARLETGGEFFDKWQWQLGVEFAPSGADNPGATAASQACTVDVTTGALVCSNRENPVDSASVKPAPTDVLVNYGPSPWINAQVGQYYIPFSLENRISDNTTPFLERSLAVRSLGAPLQRDIGAMAWGESPDRVFYYAVGVFNGDGPNRPNPDDRFDLDGRVFARPFARALQSFTKWSEIGLSARGGSRDPKYVGYDMPAMTTQEGFAFWRPTYKDSLGRLLHVIPSASQWAVGADVHLPICIVDVTSEIIYARSETREAIDGLQLSPFTERLGALEGYSYYVEAGVWLLGDQEVIGYPSYARPIHVDLSKPDPRPAEGVQVVGRFEQLHMNYEGASRGGKSDSKTPNGDIDVTSFTLGINYWATRHLRVSLDYGAYFFPGSEPTTATETGGPAQSAAQRAIAPGQYLAKNVDNTARDGGHGINEISARFGVQF